MRILRFCLNGRVPPWRVRCCASFGERARGMLGREPRRGEPWVFRLQPCRAIHSFGMRNAIDVVFCGAGGEILRIVEALPPRRLCWSWRAQAVWEFPAGAARHLQLRRGDWLLPLDGVSPQGSR